jgi:hypothetical protein
MLCWWAWWPLCVDGFVFFFVVVFFVSLVGGACWFPFVCCGFGFHFVSAWFASPLLLAGIVYLGVWAVSVPSFLLVGCSPPLLARFLDLPFRVWRVLLLLMFWRFLLPLVF